MDLQQQPGIFRQVGAIFFLVCEHGHVVHFDNCYSEEDRQA